MSIPTLLISALLVAIVQSCLITNCPRGGKRSNQRASIKECISCGPDGSGHCFGPDICCGDFGCLMGTPETLRCRHEGQFHSHEPCIAGGATCNRNKGLCAANGICCDQNSCRVDKSCRDDGLTALSDFDLLSSHQLNEFNIE